MKSLTKKVIVAAMALAVIGAGTVVAQASWTVPGTSTIKAQAANMPRGVQPSAAQRGEDALVSWSAQEIVPGVRMRKYVVTAHSLDSPPKRDLTRTVTATATYTLSTTFSGDELAGGKWYWTLVPAFERWTGAESKKSDKLAFPAAAGSGVDSLAADSATPTASAADSATPPATADPAAPTAATDLGARTAAADPATPAAPAKPDPPAPAPPAANTAAAPPEPEPEKPTSAGQTSPAADGPGTIKPESSSAPAQSE